MRISHLIIGLGNGGAETMLYNILKRKDNKDIEYELISLGCDDYFEERMKSLDITYHRLDIKKHCIMTLWELRKIIRKSDMLSCWMYHACLLGTFVSFFSKQIPILWNIRHSSFDRRYNKNRTLLIAKFCGKLSGKVDCVIYNGDAAKKSHIKAGYSPQNAFVLGNGCDTTFFYPHKERGNEIRKKYSLENKRILLSVARYHKIKDFPLIISALGIVQKRYSDCMLIICGKNVNEQNLELINNIEQNGLKAGKDVLLMDEQSNLPDWFSLAELYILHSASEAFSNTLLEAMACGAVCISTDVGTSSQVLDKECIVPIGNKEKMAKKIIEILSKPKEELREIGENNRQRIKEFFDINDIVKKYEEIYCSIDIKT